MSPQRVWHSVVDCLNAFQGKVTDQQVYSAKYPQQCIIKGKIILHHTSFGHSGPGLTVSLQLFSRSEVDPRTGKGKLSQTTYLKHGKSSKHKFSGVPTMTYEVEFSADLEFGIPGAFAIKNQHRLKFFLQSMTLQVPYNQVVHFECNSWIYPIQLTNNERVFFANTCYLPMGTPNGLVELRKEELMNLRGDGTGERKEWDRIYDYDNYNDLGDPSKGPAYERPTLGGSDLYPYPRRGRTGRSTSNCCSLFSDFRIESLQGLQDLDVYVPPDERMSPQKLKELTANIIQAAVHFVVPEAKSMFKGESSHFNSFADINALFTTHRGQESGEWVVKKVKNLVPDNLFIIIKNAIKGMSGKFSLPQIVRANEFAWKDDEEFGHQMLAGINANVIQCLQCFPPKDRNGIESAIKKFHIEHDLEGLTLEEAMNQQRIFILDHHDYLMPFLNRINTGGICAYASRTLLFLKSDAILKPIAIELSLHRDSPGEQRSTVFVPRPRGTEAALWQLAKAHVAVNDSGYHQLVNHWLHTHAVVEPFIIASRRHLSVMHPIHRLLDPHFKDTMHINALARRMVINSAGILEKTLFTGKTSMELSSALYRKWRFDKQGLPKDLLERGMALHNPDKPAGIQLLFEDYPYAADGLEIWIAIETWVTDFCSYFYKSDESLRSDTEIQEWWFEIRNVGHGDKRNETWWYPMTTLSDLIEALTTLIWIVSAFHASLNFGQYNYASYPPNRPPLCRKFIPKEGTREFSKFLVNPDMYYLKMLPQRFEMTLSIAMLEVLSRTTLEEAYLGHLLSPRWVDDVWIDQRFKQFSNELNEVGNRIKDRNKDPKLKNRRGPAKIPYELLYLGSSNAKSGEAITGNGIPASVSI